jgi:hypothetical protein
VIFVPSPLSLRIAAGIAAGAIHVLRGGYRGAVGDAVDDAVRNAVGGAVGGAVRGAVGGAGLVRFLLFCADAAYRQEWFSWWWTGWCAWASFFRDVCDLELAEWDEFAAIETTQTRGGFPMSLHADFSMVSDRPKTLRRDAGGRLHSERGPAIAWRDGWGLYFWHGLHIPRSHEWVVDEPGRITPEAIERERNTELRRIMLDRTVPHAAGPAGRARTGVQTMKLIIESTGTIERVQGVPARIWKGRTESGIEVTCWIPIVQVRKDADNSQFEAELREIEVRRELVSFDMRMVL